MLNKFFRFPWATAGDKTAIPDTTQVSGAVSYQQGYGPQYELAQSDPSSRDIERDKNNQLHADITTALQEYQTNGTPDWIDPTQNGGANYAYPAGARVRYSDGKIYISTIATNALLPTNVAGWFLETGRLVKINTIAASGVSTFNSQVGTKFVLVKAVGGGGGSGGNAAQGAGTISVAAGAGGAAYVFGIFQTGFSGGITATVGAGGAAGVGGTAGGAGGTTSLGALVSAPGGTASAAGVGIAAASSGGIAIGAVASLQGSGGNLFSALGSPGGHGYYLGGSLVGGLGGASGMGNAGPSGQGGNVPGQTALAGFGCGGSGGAVNPSSGANNGGAGAVGYLAIYEYA